MSKEMFGTVLALLTAVVSGLAIPVNKIFVVDLDPTVFTAVRAVIIGIVFLLLSFATKGFSRGSLKVNWKYLLLIAIIGGAFAFSLFFLRDQRLGVFRHTASSIDTASESWSGAASGTGAGTAGGWARKACSSSWMALSSR